MHKKFNLKRININLHHFLLHHLSFLPGSEKGTLSKSHTSGLVHFSHLECLVMSDLLSVKSITYVKIKKKFFCQSNPNLAVLDITP